MKNEQGFNRVVSGSVQLKNLDKIFLFFFVKDSLHNSNTKHLFGLV